MANIEEWFYVVRFAQRLVSVILVLMASSLITYQNQTTNLFSLTVDLKRPSHNFLMIKNR